MASQQDLITAAYQELGLIDPIETLSPEMLAFGLQKMNRLLDSWNAIREAVYVDAPGSHTLTSGLNPHTFGPTGATFTVTQRPVTVFALNLVISDVRYPVRPRDSAWYASLSTPEISAQPTDFYWAPGWANGSLYLYPVPDSAYEIELWRRVLLAQVSTVTDTFSLPPGYWDAIVRTLAEDLAPAYNVPVAGDLRVKAEAARAIVFANNLETPRIRTRDSGMPGGASADGGFNWITRTGGGAHW